MTFENNPRRLSKVEMEVFTLGGITIARLMTTYHVSCSSFMHNHNILKAVTTIQLWIGAWDVVPREIRFKNDCLLNETKTKQ
jgi:hypothetical protein